jgi:hypothetical protein
MTVGVLERYLWAIVEVCTHLAETVTVARRTFFDNPGLTAAIRQQAVRCRTDIGVVLVVQNGFAIFPVADVVHIGGGKLS